MQLISTSGIPLMRFKSHWPAINIYGWLKKYPAFYIAFPATLGCAFYFLDSWFYLLSFVAIILVLALKQFSRALFSAIFFGLWLSILHMVYPKNLPPQLPHVMEGEITKIRLDFPRHLILKWKKWNLQIQNPDSLWLSGQKIGNHIQAVNPVPIAIEAMRNPGEFNQKAYLKASNISGVFKIDSAIYTSAPPLFKKSLGRVQNWIEHQLDKYISTPYLPLVKACILGNRSFLSQNTKLQFSQSGMYHLLAISGMHIAIISLVLLKLLWLLRLPKKTAYILTSLFLLAYIFISGQSPSVIRASLMFSFAAPAFINGQRSYSFNSFLLALSCCLFWIPYQIQAPGLLLSFCATFFLIHYLGRQSPNPVPAHLMGKALRGITSTIKISCLLSLATYPLCATFFHQATPMAIFGNCVTIMLMSLLMLSSSLCLVASIFWPFGAEILGNSAALFANWLLGSVEIISNLEWSHFYVKAPHMLSTTCLFIILFCWPYRKQDHFKKTIFGCVLLLAGFFCYCQGQKYFREEVEISFLDVGQGDAVFMELPGNFRVLIDAGKGSYNNGKGKSVILPFLKERGIRNIDLAIITHSDLDHYGGFLYLSSQLQIKNVAQSFYPNDNRTWEDLNQNFAEKNIPVHQPLCGDTLYHYKKLVLKVESPCRNMEYKGKNNNSLVVQLYHPNGNILLTGDVEEEAEINLSQRNWKKVHILKLAHHGSKTSSHPDLLEKLQPNISIVSAGRKNSYGFPHEATLKNLEKLKTRVLSTQQKGYIAFKTAKNSKNWERSDLNRSLNPPLEEFDYYANK